MEVIIIEHVAKEINQCLCKGGASRDSHKLAHQVLSKSISILVFLFSIATLIIICKQLINFLQSRTPIKQSILYENYCMSA